MLTIINDPHSSYDRRGRNASSSVLHRASIRGVCSDAGGFGVETCHEPLDARPNLLDPGIGEGEPDVPIGTAISRKRLPREHEHTVCPAESKPIRARNVARISLELSPDEHATGGLAKREMVFSHR